MKTCTKCGQSKPLDSYYLVNSKSKGIFRKAQCKDCIKSAKRAAHKPGDGREFFLKRRYGLTQADYDVMFSECGGVCEICKQPSTLLEVDHCHSTGKVRGLLCNRCNKALGMFKDDISNFQNAITYLNRNG